MKAVVPCLFFVLLGFLSFGQIQVVEDQDISSLMSKFLTKNQLQENVKAWRIQIITTSDRREMQNTQYRFGQDFPSMQMSWKHVPPYYKVTVGAWRDKISCDAFLAQLKRSFPLAIPVVESIPKVEFLN